MLIHPQKCHDWNKSEKQLIKMNLAWW